VFLGVFLPVLPNLTVLPPPPPGIQKSYHILCMPLLVSN
jgi:hypothetical protein